jgi:long-chain acyl-CoA synthetase
MELESVTGVCVFGVPDAQWGEAIKAVVEVPAVQGLTAAAVSEYVGSRIARYKRPRWVEFTTSLPRSTVGMVDRDAVQSLWGKPPEG